MNKPPFSVPVHPPILLPEGVLVKAAPAIQPSEKCRNENAPHILPLPEYLSTRLPPRARRTPCPRSFHLSTESSPLRMKTWTIPLEKSEGDCFLPGKGSPGRRSPARPDRRFTPKVPEWRPSRVAGLLRRKSVRCHQASVFADVFVLRSVIRYGELRGAGEKGDSPRIGVDRRGGSPYIDPDPYVHVRIRAERERSGGPRGKGRERAGKETHKRSERRSGSMWVFEPHGR